IGGIEASRAHDSPASFFLCTPFASTSTVCHMDQRPRSMVSTSRRAWPRVRPAMWAAAVATVAIVVVCAVNSLRWVNRPFRGFFRWEKRLVPAVGDTDWSGYKAGVPFGSQLMVMDGQAVSSADQVYRRAAALPPGTPVTYTFAVTPELDRVTVVVAT